MTDTPKSGLDMRRQVMGDAFRAAQEVIDS
jgi:hypothetical protein